MIRRPPRSTPLSSSAASDVYNGQTTKAARIFQEEIIGQVSAETINRQEESEAYADLLDDEAERAGYNVGYGTLDMVNMTKTNRKFW